MKSRGFSYWWLIAVVALAAIAGAIIFPIIAIRQQSQLREERGQRVCTSNLKQIALAFELYARDNNDHLPLTRVHTFAESKPPSDLPYGWVDALFPYIKSKRVFRCSFNSRLVTREYDGRYRTDYFYNSNLHGLTTKSVASPASTILAGDGNEKRDTRYALNVLPERWLNDDKSPAHRHKGGANYVFVDGHVKWLKPDQISALRPSKNSHSFAVR